MRCTTQHALAVMGQYVEPAIFVGVGDANISADQNNLTHTLGSVRLPVWLVWQRARGAAVGAM